MKLCFLLLSLISTMRTIAIDMTKVSAAKKESIYHEVNGLYYSHGWSVLDREGFARNAIKEYDPNKGMSWQAFSMGSAEKKKFTKEVTVKFCREALL